jgi:hypothetical protein
MLDTIFGLPTHALVVHAVVILLPLGALGAAAIAVYPPWRRRYGLLVAAVTVIGVASVPVATHSGQHLLERKNATFGPGDDVEAGLMNRHSVLGEELLPWAVLLGVGVLLVVGVTYLVHRNGTTATATADGPPLWIKGVSYLGIAASLVGAVLSIIMVARIGHAGAKAAWTPVVNASNQH